MVNNYKKNWFELGVAIAIFFVIFFGEWLGLVQPVTSFFERMLQPTVKRVSLLVMNVSQPLTLFKNSFTAAERVQELEQEYSQSLARISELEHLELENKDLRQLLQAQEKMTPVIIAAPIISRGQPSISVGQAEEVSVGQPVLVSKTLVGLIKSASSHQSVVGLLSQNTATSILAKTASGIEGLIVGNGKDILFTEIPKEAEVLVGDLVVTMGQEKIQSQLVVGRVQQLIDQPSAPIKEAIIQQEVSFYEASIVEVLQ